jgi:hypothetical protein
MNDFKEFEKRILEIITNKLQKFSLLLKKNGITYKEPKIVVWKHKSEEYESEFRVSFFQKDSFLDWIEQHIFRDGKKIAELEEFDSWIEDDMLEIIKETEEEQRKNLTGLGGGQQ